jgi:hypothetical protein
MHRGRSACRKLCETITFLSFPTPYGERKPTLEYPAWLHNVHNDLSLALERVSLGFNDASDPHGQHVSVNGAVHYLNEGFFDCPFSQAPARPDAHMTCRPVMIRTRWLVNTLVLR